MNMSVIGVVKSGMMLLPQKKDLKTVERVKQMSKKKKDENEIFNGIRKKTAPPSKRIKTRKGESDRKKKHKGKEEEEA